NLEVYVDDLVIKSHTEAELLRDIEEMFHTLRKIDMKPNLKKCTFGAVEGMFLGYMIGPEGIKPCPKKIEVVLQLPSPQTIKEVQSLNGKLAGLNRFLYKSTEKSLPLFKTLKKCVKKSDFRWTPEAEQAFKQLKQHISELPMLVTPRPKEELIMYLSASQRAVGAVLMTERDSIQTPVYFVSRALQVPELNYTPMEKLVLALVFAAKRLRSIMLGKHNITYRPRTSVKGQILADFLVEKPEEASADMLEKEAPQEPWTLFTDGSSCIDGSGTEYEALLAGMRIAAQMGVRNIRVSVDSKLVANHVLGTYIAKEENMIKYLEKVLVEVLQEKSIQEQEVAAVVEEEGPTWITPITEYLKDRVLPDDKKDASKLRIKSRQYELMDGILYRRSFLRPWLRTWEGQILDSRHELLYKMDRSKGGGNHQWRSSKKRFASVKHPQSNGLVKRANRSLGEGIKARLGEGNKNWIEEIPHVLWAHRIMIKSSNGDTPFSLTCGTEAVIPAEIGIPTYRTAAVDIVRSDDEIRLNLDLRWSIQAKAYGRSGPSADVEHRQPQEVLSLSHDSRMDWAKPTEKHLKVGLLTSARGCKDTFKSTSVCGSVKISVSARKNDNGLFSWSSKKPRLSTCSESQREDALLLGQFVAADTDSKVHIVQRGAVGPLLEMLKSPEAQLREMLAFALGRLAQDTHNQAGIAHSGGIVPLLKLLDSRNGTLQHNGAFTLYGLADNEDNVADLISLGSVQKLMDGEFIVQGTAPHQNQRSVRPTARPFPRTEYSPAHPHAS
ncbi:reverse transcriptase domain-containing protein, partial [Tanacetum coccineum]